MTAWVEFTVAVGFIVVCVVAFLADMDDWFGSEPDWVRETADEIASLPEVAA